MQKVAAFSRSISQLGLWAMNLLKFNAKFMWVCMYIFLARRPTAFLSLKAPTMRLCLAKKVSLLHTDWSWNHQVIIPQSFVPLCKTLSTGLVQKCVFASTGTPPTGTFVFWKNKSLYRWCPSYQDPKVTLTVLKFHCSHRSNFHWLICGTYRNRNFQRAFHVPVEDL